MLEPLWVGEEEDVHTFTRSMSGPVEHTGDIVLGWRDSGVVFLHGCVIVGWCGCGTSLDAGLILTTQPVGHHAHRSPPVPTPLAIH